MQLTSQKNANRDLCLRAFTLVEVVVSIAIAGLIFGSVIFAYVQAAQRSEWCAYSLAAQALSVRQTEQAMAAKWDTQANPVIEQITNIPASSWTNLDIPYSGTNYVRATNYVTKTKMVVTNDTANFYYIRVDTVWPFRNKLYTNTTATYRAPDQ